MTREALELLLIELERRESLKAYIDFVIEKDFAPFEDAKLKKGLVHDHVAKELGVEMSPALRALINERMDACGYATRVKDGYHYFKDIRINAWL